MQTGPNTISKLMLGSHPVQRVILGGAEVWSAFSPLDLAPALWVSDGGADRAIWEDLSGNARHWTQPTPTQQPALAAASLNGYQTRKFDGFDDWMAWPPVAVRTAVAIYRRNGPQAAYATLFGHGTEFSQYYNTAGTNNWVDPIYTRLGWRQGAWRRSGVPFNPSLANSDPLGEWLILSITTDRATQTSQTRDRSNPDRVPKIDLGEVLLFDSPLAAADLETLESYLSTKWGIPLA